MDDRPSTTPRPRPARWRQAGILSVAAILVIGTTGCGREQEGSGTDQPSASGEFSLARAASPYRGQTIRIVGEALPPLEALKQLKQEFERESGIRVEVEGFDYDTMIERATLDISSGTGRYDLILQAPESWGRFAASGKLHTLEHFRSNPRLNDPSVQPEDQLFPKAWRDLGWYADTAYGYPFSVLTMALWYRKDLLADAAEQRRFAERYGYPLAVPEDWRQYHDVAEFFTRPGSGLYGTLLQGKRHASLWQEWLNFAFSFGGGTLKKDDAWDYGQIVVNCPESVEATKYYKGLLAFSPPGTLEYTWDDALAAFQQGKVAMALMWTDMTPAVEDPDASKVAGNVGYGPPPAGRSGSVSQLSGSAYLIPKTARNADAAYLFEQWMMRSGNQKRMHLAGGQSGLRSVYADPEVSKLPYSEGTYETLLVGMSMRETIPEAAAIGEKVQIGLSEILHNRRTVEDGLDWIAGELEKLTRGKSTIACPLRRAA